MDNKSMNKNIDSYSRTYWIDALKLFSMIVVLLTHLQMSFFQDLDTSFHIGNINIYKFYFGGSFAVAMFLFISVYLAGKKGVSNKFNQQNFLFEVEKRYLRLFIPAVLVQLLILVLYVAKLFYNDRVDFDSIYVKEWFQFGSPLEAIVRFICSSICLCLFQKGMNPPLWCYSYFFIFPCLMLCMTQLFEDNKKTFIINLFLLLASVLANSYFAIIPLCFLVYKIENKNKIVNGIISFSIIIILKLMGIFVFPNYPIISKYVGLSLEIITVGCYFVLLQSLNGFIFNLKIFSILNKIGFQIYLLHMPIICSVGYGILYYTQNKPLSVICSLICLVIASIINYYLVEIKLTSKVLKIIKKE